MQHHKRASPAAAAAQDMQASPTSVARGDMETATPSKENDVNPLHISGAVEEDDVRLYWRKRQLRQKYCSLLCMLLTGFFVGFGTGAGVFIQKDWGGDDDEAVSTPDTIIVADFTDGIPWNQKNDPVMGGDSTGTFTVTDGVGLMSGSVEIVSFLNAPGFIKAEKEAVYPDISTCSGLVVSCAHFTGDPSAEYAGYRIGFGRQRAPEDLDPHKWSSGFKAPFAPGMNLMDVEIPFTAFSDDWDDATGDVIVTCAEDERVCPTGSVLRDIQTLSVWAEGVEGAVHLELHSIKAINCGGGRWSHAAATDEAEDESADGGEGD